MLRMDLKNVLNLLLLHLSTHRERVLAGIKMLAEMSQSAEGSGQLPLDSDKRIVCYWHVCINYSTFARDVFVRHPRACSARGGGLIKPQHPE